MNGLKSADVDAPGRKRLWGRNVLVVAQVSMSLMLLTASFLMARSFQHSVVEGTGFAKDHLLMARFDPRLVQYNAAQTQQFYKLLAERVREAPGVRERGAHAEPAARTGRLRPRRLRAGRVSDAARSRELHVDDGHRR